MREAPATVEPRDLLRRLGARIRAARAARGATRVSLCQRSGLSLRYLAQLEAGTANISLERLADVARALDLDLSALVAMPDGPGPQAREGAETSAHGPEHEVAALLQGRSAAELVEVRDWLRARFAPARGPIVALLGLRGAGKSTVGKRLARRLGVPFHELDALVERVAGLPLAQIFELQGEPSFRRLERQTLVQFLAATDAAVLATGGGLVADPETFALLRARCTTVWLQATPELHWRRVVRQGDSRPMRGHPQAMQELRALLRARAPLYAQAHVRCDTTGRSAAAVAADLAARLAPPARPAAGRRRRPGLAR